MTAQQFFAVLGLVVTIGLGSVVIAHFIVNRLWQSFQSGASAVRLMALVQAGRRCEGAEAENRSLHETLQQAWTGHDNLTARLDGFAAIGARLIEANNAGDLDAWDEALHEMHAAMGGSLYPAPEPAGVASPLLSVPLKVAA